MFRKLVSTVFIGLIGLQLYAAITQFPANAGGGGGGVTTINGAAGAITLAVGTSGAAGINLGNTPAGTFTVNVPIATQAEAQIATNNTQMMTPLRTADAIAALCALPSQAGQSGNYLTTNGTVASWAPVAAGGGFMYNWVASRAQNTIASAGGSLGDFSSGVHPTAAVFTGSNRVGGYLVFTDSVTQPIYDQFELPTGTLPTINADFYTTTSGTSTSSATLRIYTASSGTSLDPAWGAAQSVTFTPAGTANTLVKTTISGLTVSGAAGDMLYFKIDRNTADANTQDIRLVNVKFYQ